MAEIAARACAERDAAVRAALEQAAVLNREQLGTAASAVTTQRPGRPGGEEGRHRHPPRRGPARRCAPSCSASARWSPSSARRAPSASGRSTSRCARHAEVASTLADSTRMLREALANPQATGPMGRADGRGRAAPGRVHRARQLPQADPGRRRHRPARLHVRPAQGPRPVHGRQVPAGLVPALPRGRHRRRAPGPPQALPRRRAAAGQGAGQAGLRPRGRPAGRRLRAAVPAQRAAGRVHPRARPRACSTTRWASGS